MHLRSYGILASLCALGLMANSVSSAPPYRGHLPTNAAVAARSSFAFRPTSTMGSTNFSLAHNNYTWALANNQTAASRAWRENNHFVRNFEFRNGYYPYGFYNPYAYSAYRYYPYGYYPTYPGYLATPSYGSGGSGDVYNTYNTYSSGLSPYSYGVTAPYGNTSPATAMPAPESYPAADAKTPPPNAAQPLTAFGIPNDKGTVSWPQAFRLMAPAQKKDLLQKAEAQLQIVSTQAVVGSSNPLLLRETGRSVDQLRQWLREHRVNMTEANFREGEVFLGKLDKALTAMTPT
jgi:hypothetical protein